MATLFFYLEAFHFVDGLALHPFFKGGDLLKPFLADSGRVLHVVIKTQFLLGLDCGTLVVGDGHFGVKVYLGLGRVDPHVEDLAVFIKSHCDNCGVGLGHSCHSFGGVLGTCD